MNDYCPARVTPLPPGVPSGRQLRAVLDRGWLTVMWMDGAAVEILQTPGLGYEVRQVGCRCTANPRLVDAAVS